MTAAGESLIRDRNAIVRSAQNLFCSQIIACQHFLNPWAMLRRHLLHIYALHLIFWQGLWEHVQWLILFNIITDWHCPWARINLRSCLPCLLTSFQCKHLLGWIDLLLGHLQGLFAFLMMGNVYKVSHTPWLSCLGIYRISFLVEISCIVCSHKGIKELFTSSSRYGRTGSEPLMKGQKEES